MDIESRYLQSVREAPADDAPRLGYADWLEEQGDPRGEFIRVQCQLATMDENDAQHEALMRREHELLEKHEKQWVRNLHIRNLVYASFVRGFIEKIRLRGKSVFQTITKLYQSSLVSCITDLSLRGSHCGDKG